MAWPFWGARMPAVNNALQSAKDFEQGRKDAEDSGNEQDEKSYRENRERSFDTCDKHLRDARRETEEAIRKRDAGESREDDPDVRLQGWFW